MYFSGATRSCALEQHAGVVLLAFEPELIGAEEEEKEVVGIALEGFLEAFAMFGEVLVVVAVELGGTETLAGQARLAARALIDRIDCFAELPQRDLDLGEEQVGKRVVGLGADGLSEAALGPAEFADRERLGASATRRAFSSFGLSAGFSSGSFFGISAGFSGFFAAGGASGRTRSGR